MITRATLSTIEQGLPKYRSMLAGNTAYVPPGDFESIATTTVGAGGVSSVVFSSIPATYTHLQIRCIAQAQTSQNLFLRFNGDGDDNNYTFHNLRGDGASVSVLSFTPGVTNSFLIVNGGASITANTFAGSVIDILDYRNTNKYTTVRSIGGYDANGTGIIQLGSKLWLNTAAITSLELNSFANNLQQYTQFALYGIRNT